MNTMGIKTYWGAKVFPRWNFLPFFVFCWFVLHFIKWINQTIKGKLWTLCITPSKEERNSIRHPQEFLILSRGDICVPCHWGEIGMACWSKPYWRRFQFAKVFLSTISLYFNFASCRLHLWSSPWGGSILCRQSIFDAVNILSRTSEGD